MDSPAELWILSLPNTTGQLFGQLGRISAEFGVNLRFRDSREADGTRAEVTGDAANPGSSSSLDERPRKETDLNRGSL